MTAPLLTDQAARQRFLARARRAPELFAFEAAADDIQERLEAVNRTFTQAAVVTDWPEVWAERLPGAEIIAPDDTLTFSTTGYDLIIHAMCLHWANDPIGQMVQCRLAMRADGLFLGALFGGGTLQELRTCLAQAESDVSGGLSPRVLPMGEIRDLGGLLQRAGFALPVADHLPLDVAYRSFDGLIRDLRGMGESNAMTARTRTPTSRRIFDRAAEIYAQNFTNDAGQLRASYDIVALTGWAPSDTQQKPLRPGSAQNRLAQALGTVEMPLDAGPDRTILNDTKDE